VLKIRKSQWDRLSHQYHEQFVAEAARHLRTRFPENLASVDDAALDGRVRQGILSARHYRINEEDDVLQFLEYLVSFGPDFADQPWAAEVLNDRSASGPVKMRRLGDRELDALRRGGRACGNYAGR
jgi:hypothetical protein